RVATVTGVQTCALPISYVGVDGSEGATLGFVEGPPLSDTILVLRRRSPFQFPLSDSLLPMKVPPRADKVVPHSCFQRTRHLSCSGMRVGLDTRDLKFSG